jgi:hypothetical protein
LSKGGGHMKKRALIILNIVKVAILFITCTILFYFAIQWIHSEYEDMHRYDRPEGSMLKVDKNKDNSLKQLVRFYQNGE